MSGIDKNSTEVPEVDLAITTLAAAVLARKLSVPAIFLLELHKPLAGIMREVVDVSTPFLHLLFGRSNVERARIVLSSRETLEALIVAIEKGEAHGRS